MRAILSPTPGGGPVCSGYKVFVDEREVGRLSPEKRVFYKFVEELKHLARKVDGYGIEEALCDKLFARGTSLEAVCITEEREDGRRFRYFVPTRIWRDEGRILTLSEEFGAQRFLNRTRIREADRRYRSEANAYMFADTTLQTVLPA